MKHIKNILSALIALAMILTLAACAGGGQTPEQAAGTESRAENTSAPSGKTGSDVENGTDEAAAATESKTLVVYFSRTGEQYTVGVIDKGNTAIVAEFIAEKTGADLWEVLPADGRYPMTYSALHRHCKERAKRQSAPGLQRDGSRSFRIRDRVHRRSRMVGRLADDHVHLL